MSKLFIIPLLVTIFTAETLPVEPGTYPVIISYEGEHGEASFVSKTTIVSDNYINVDDVVIDATDIYTTKDQKIDSSFLVYESKVKAWNISNNEVYKIEKISTRFINDEQYEVTFTTIKNISITVNMYIISDKELYNKFIEKPSENYILAVKKENYLKYAFLYILIILIFIALLTNFLAQRKVKLQIEGVMKKVIIK